MRVRYLGCCVSVRIGVFFFFFKQKTAYEMRISDWSSDVCSSDLPYTSGLLTTRDSFAQSYGYFEIRADMPEGQGLWPAFWLLPVDGRWPPELDVIEIFGQDPERPILSSHSAASGSHTIDRHIADVAPSDGFHSYGVLWGPEEIVWAIDGVAVAETAQPADMPDPRYLVSNVGFG